MNHPLTASTEHERMEIASDWLLRMQAEPITEQELASWLRWYDADPANRLAFEKVQETFEAIHGQPQESKTSWARQLTVAPDAASPRHSGVGRNPFPWLSHHRALFAAAATALAFAIGIGAWQWQQSESVQTAAFKTERATHRLVSLPDGSKVRLGAKSQLFTNFTPQTRYLVLEGGEAFFEVAKDLARPFLVQAGTVTVRAVGTEFNVRRVNDQTIVAVAEGRVEIVQESPTSKSAKPVRLSAGEQATIGPILATVSLYQVETSKVGSWRDGRLEFVDEPLGAVIGTINRYSASDVVITDSALGDLRFTGTVSRERIDEWLVALPEVFPVTVRREGNETVLISRSSAP
jgi:transmembrane sensor